MLSSLLLHMPRCLLTETIQIGGSLASSARECAVGSICLYNAYLVRGFTGQMYIKTIDNKCGESGAKTSNE